MKSNKLLILIVIFVLGVGAYYLLSNGNRKPDNEPKEEVKENEEEKNILYGFAYVYKDNKQYKIMALNSKDKDVELANGEGEITLSIKNNKLYYINKRSLDDTDYNYYKDTKIQYIDLEDELHIPSLLVENVEIYENYSYDNKDYIFTYKPNGGNRYKGFKKYDTRARKETEFEEENWVNDLFTYNDKVYYIVTTGDHPNKNSQKYYYEMDSKGKIKNNIKKEDYEELKKEYIEKEGYKEEIKNNADIYLMKNNKKVYYDKSKKQLFLGDKSIYTLKENAKDLVLGYSEESNMIYFKEITNSSTKYYSYDLSTNKVDEINKELYNDFKEVIK